MTSPDEIARIQNRILELEREIVHAQERLTSVSKELSSLRTALTDTPSDEVPAQATKSAPEVAVPPSSPSTATSASTSTTTPTPAQAPTSMRPPSLKAGVTENSQTRSVFTLPPRPRVATPPRKPVPGLFTRLRAAIAERIGDVPLEDFIGTNLLLKAGVFILVAGLIYFVKVAYEAWFGPWLKLATLAVLSITALVGGHILHRRPNLRLFGLWIIAGGSMLLYYCVYASYGVEATRVIPQDKSFLAYLFLLPMAGLLIWNSLRYDSETMTGGIYFLAFFAISLNETGGLNYTFAMTALVFLAGGLIIILFLRRWKYLTGLGLLATYGNFLLYSRALPRDAEGFVLRGSDADPADYFLRGLLYLAIYWVIFTVSAFTMRSDTAKERRIAASVHIGNAFTFLALCVFIRPAPMLWGSFLVTSIMGVVYIGLAILGRRLGKDFIWKSSLVIGLGLLMLAPALKFSDYGLTFAWLVQSSVLIILGYMLRETYLRNAGYLALLLKLGAFFLLPASTYIHSTSAGASLWTFDWNRGFLYVFMIVAFLGLRITATHYAKDANRQDRIAQRAFGVLTILTMILLAYHVLRIPHQAFLLIPFAVLTAAYEILMARVSGSETSAVHLRSWVNLRGSVVLILAAVFSALPLLILSPNPDRIPSSFATLLIIAAGAGALFAYEILFNKPRPAVSDAGTPPWYAGPRLHGEILLWTAAATLTSMAGHYGALEAVNVFILLLAGGLLVLNRFTGFGLYQASALFLHGFLTTTYFYLVSKGDDSTGGAVFLWNAGIYTAFLAFYLVAANGLLVSSRVADNLLGESKTRSAPGLRAFAAVLFSVTAFQIMEHLLDAPALQAGFAGFALLCAGIGYLSRLRLFFFISAAYQLMTLLSGPLYWAVQAPDVGTDVYRMSLSIIGPAVSLVALLFTAGRTRMQSESPVFEFAAAGAYIAALTSWFCYTFLLVPDIYQPSAFALLTAANYYLIKRFALRKLYKSAPMPFIITCISFAYLLTTFTGPEPSAETTLRALTGLIPLVLLAVSLVLHGSLSPEERLTRFQSAGVGALLLGFILLTMTVIQSSYWTLAWVVEAFVLIVAGLRWNFRVLRYGGMALIGIALVKLAGWDVRKLDDNARIAVLIGVGILFVIASYLYAKFRERLFPKQETETETESEKP